MNKALVVTLIVYVSVYACLRVTNYISVLDNVTNDVRPGHQLPLMQGTWIEVRDAEAWVPVVFAQSVVCYRMSNKYVSKVLATIYYPVSSVGL